jgi:uncharacterized protein
MLGCTASFTEPSSDPASSPQDVYIHGYVSGRIFKASQSSSEGLPITIAATHLDGLVLALAPFHNSCNYRSAVVYGYASFVTDEQERLFAMEKITDNLLPTRWSNSRNPPTKAELQSTSILRVKVESASAKVRTGGPSDEKKDLKDTDLVKSVWTGVVPVWMQWGEPIESKDNGAGEVEGYIERWRMQENQKGKMGAYEAIQKES